MLEEWHYRFGHEPPGEYLLLLTKKGNSKSWSLKKIDGQSYSEVKCNPTTCRYLAYLLQNIGSEKSQSDIKEAIGDLSIHSLNHILRTQLNLDNDPESNPALIARNNHVGLRIENCSQIDPDKTLDIILAEQMLPSGIREITQDLFGQSEGFDQNAKLFLQGDQPTPETAAGVAMPHPSLGELEQLVKKHRFINLFGPMGDGKSTLALQLTQSFLSSGPNRAFQVLSFDALNYIGKLNQFDENKLYVVDVDRIPKGKKNKVLPWIDRISTSVRTNFCVLFVARSFRSGRVSNWFRSSAPGFSLHRTKIGEFSPESSNQFVSTVLLHEATIGTRDEKKLRTLYESGLANGGLWPAIYQVTRGEELLQRALKLVDNLAIERHGKSAVEWGLFSAVTFLNGLEVLSGRGDSPNPHIPAPTKSRACSLGQLMCGHSSPQKLQQSIPLFLEKWQGELDRHTESSPLTPSATIRFRHPSLSHAFFGALFGFTHRKDREVYLSKWHWYQHAISQSKVPEAHVAILNSMYSAMSADIRSINSALRRDLKKDRGSAVGDYILEAAKASLEQLKTIKLADQTRISSATRLIHVLLAKFISSESRINAFSKEQRKQAYEEAVSFSEKALAITPPPIPSPMYVDIAKISAKTQSKISGMTWRKLIFEAKSTAGNDAQSIERADSAQLKMAIEEAIETSTVDTVEIHNLIRDSNLLTGSNWDYYDHGMRPSRRMWVLLRLLPYIDELELDHLVGAPTKETVQEDCAAKDSRNTLYQLVSQELYRLKLKPSLKSSSVYKNPDQESGFGPLLLELFKSWAADCEEDGFWPESTASFLKQCKDTNSVSGCWALDSWLMESQII